MKSAAVTLLTAAQLISAQLVTDYSVFFQNVLPAGESYQCGSMMDENYYYLGTQSGTIHVFDHTSGELIASQHTNYGWPRAFLKAQDGALYSLHANKMVKWDSALSAELWAVNIGGYSMAQYTDTSVVVGSDASVLLVNTANGYLINRIDDLHGHDVRQIIVNGNEVISGSWGTFIKSSTFYPKWNASWTPTPAFTGEVIGIAKWGNTLISTTQYGGPVLWNISTRSVLGIYNTPADGDTRIAVIAGSLLYVSRSQMNLVNLETGEIQFMTLPYMYSMASFGNLVCGHSANIMIGCWRNTSMVWHQDYFQRSAVGISRNFYFFISLSGTLLKFTLQGVFVSSEQLSSTATVPHLFSFPGAHIYLDEDNRRAIHFSLETETKLFEIGLPNIPYSAYFSGMYTFIGCAMSILRYEIQNDDVKEFTVDITVLSIAASEQFVYTASDSSPSSILRKYPISFQGQPVSLSGHTGKVDSLLVYGGYLYVGGEGIRRIQVTSNSATLSPLLGGQLLYVGVMFAKNGWLFAAESPASSNRIFQLNIAITNPTLVKTYIGHTAPVFSIYIYNGTMISCDDASQTLTWKVPETFEVSHTNRTLNVRSMTTLTTRKLRSSTSSDESTPQDETLNQPALSMSSVMSLVWLGGMILVFPALALIGYLRRLPPFRQAHRPKQTRRT